MMKVDRQKVLALADVLQEALVKHLDKTPMSAGEIALALTQVIYRVGCISAEMGREEALREKGWRQQIDAVANTVKREKALREKERVAA